MRSSVSFSCSVLHPIFNLIHNLIYNLIINLIINHIYNLLFHSFIDDKQTMVKRWKFSHPNSIYPDPYVEVAPGLFLAGDSFGGPSITGAFLSAEKLGNYFLNKEEKK